MLTEGTQALLLLSLQLPLSKSQQLLALMNHIGSELAGEGCTILLEECSLFVGLVGSVKSLPEPIWRHAASSLALLEACSLDPGL